MKNNSKPLVAVRSLVYNHAPYLHDYFKGVLSQQTNFPYIVVVHDDCSTDGSRKIIEQYATQYPDIIKPIFEEVNCYTRGWNIAEDKIQLAYGDAKYIAICEGDDYWTDPLKLQKQVDFLEEHEDVGLCYTDWNRLYDESGQITKDIFQSNPDALPVDMDDFLIRKLYIAPMTWMYRRYAWERIRDSKGAKTDGTFAYALDFYARSKVAYLPYTTATYRLHVGSASNAGDIKRQFIYDKGVFQTQVYYAQKYNPSLLVRVCLRNYMELLPAAEKLGETEFVEEALAYLKKYDLDVIYNYWQNDRRLNESARNSKAFKLGTVLLTPLKLLTGRK